MRVFVQLLRLHLEAQKWMLFIMSIGAFSVPLGLMRLLGSPVFASDLGRLDEAVARSDRFKDAPKDLLNNGDILSITCPDTIGDIHKRFLEAGSDIVETNTFSATSIAQSEFFTEDPRESGAGRKDPEFYQQVIEDASLNDLAWEINVESAKLMLRIARQTGRKLTDTDPARCEGADTAEVEPPAA